MPPEPVRLLRLQWHITERCNLRCAHCYQETHSGEELRFKDLLGIFEQFKALPDRLSQRTSLSSVRGHINITGGEPFVRRDFLDLLKAFQADKKRISFGILTNGTFIDGNMACQLGRLGVSSVQVSLEGAKETNDRIRGPGTFDKTITALRHLVRERVTSLISFTAHRGNFREFDEVARVGREIGVSKVWADRLIPCGGGSGLMEQVLSPEETREFFEVMYRAHGEAAQSFCKTEVAMHRALQFLVGGGKPYHCGAGNTLVTVQPNGDLYPCRRMPIRVGNVMETPLLELYEKSDLFRALRNHKRISEGCEDCPYAKQCRGGLKCLSFALMDDPFKADPGCWRASANHKLAAIEAHGVSG